MSINVTKVLSRTFLGIHQNVAQGADSTQIMNIDCSDSSTSSKCVKCIKKTGDLFNEPLKHTDEIERLCGFVCDCNVSNINMSQIIRLDLKTTMKTVNTTKFQNRFLSELYYEANQKQVGLFSLKSNLKALNISVSKIYTKMYTKEFMTAIKAVSTLQTLDFKGPGTLTNVDMTILVDFVAVSIQKFETLQSDLVTLVTLITTITTQIVEAGLAQVILRIIQIILVVVIVLLALYCSQLFFSLFILAVI